MNKQDEHPSMMMDSAANNKQVDGKADDCREKQVNDDNQRRLKRVLYMTCGSIAGCTVIHLCANEFWKRGWITSVDRLKSLRLNQEDYINLSEKVVSTLHAAISSKLAYDLVFKNDQNFFALKPGNGGNMWTNYPSGSDTLFSISLGYSIYDTLTMIAQKSMDSSMWIHHLMTIIGCAASMWFKQTTILSTSMLFTEITVLPTNVQWYLQKFGRRGSTRYKVASILKMIFFICFRVGVGPYVMIRAIREGHLKNFRQISPTAQIMSSSITIALSLLNLLWTYMVIRNTLRTIKKKSY